MKINSNLISLILKLVGGILIIAGILDYIFSIVPSQWQDINWQVTLVNNLVNQAVLPLVGICFIFLSWWVEDNHNISSSSGLRISVLTLSGLLGLFFLLLIPLHLSNVGQISNQMTARLDEQVAQQEAQLQGIVAQLEAISQNPEALKQEVEQRNQIINSGGTLQGQQLTPQQLQLLARETQQLQEILDLSGNPEQLQARLDDVKNARESELKARETEERNNIRNVALQQSLKTSVRSLIFSIAYAVVAGFGFRSMMTKVS